MSDSRTSDPATISERGDRKRFRAIRTAQLTLVLRADAPSVPGGRLPLADVQELTLGRGRKGIGDERTPEGRFVSWSVDDHVVSRAHARLERDRAGWRLTDLKSKNGTFVNGRRIEEQLLRDGDVARVGSAFFLFRVGEMREDRAAAPLVFESAVGLNAFATLSASLGDQLEQARDVAPTTLPILITGETGVGKELVARELHERSQRRGPLVAVNCGAIAQTLVESELFGHRQGSFSGATEDRVGLVRRADRGTLFLDEIAELGESSQVALLRVLQEGEVRPVGATDPIAVDVRVIAATNRDLRVEIGHTRFRDDLLSRLRGHELRMPPLRERREDIGLIVARLLATTFESQVGKIRFTNAAARALLTYDFPRNIRELEHALQRAIALAKGEPIAVSHLPDELARSRDRAVAHAAGDDQLAARLADVLEQNRGNISATARAFGKAPIQIRRWCQRFGIDFEQFRR